jgi:hypothetical protein
MCNFLLLILTEKFYKGMCMYFLLLNVYLVVFELPFDFSHNKFIYKLIFNKLYENNADEFCYIILS